jgi:hypothetical protein
MRAFLFPLDIMVADRGSLDVRAVDIVRVLYNYKTKLEQAQGDGHHKKDRAPTHGPRKNNKSRYGNVAMS